MSLNTYLGKWADPLATLGIIIGIVSWVFTSYNKIENNSQSIESINSDFSEYKLLSNESVGEIHEKVSDQGEKLGKIEGKLDMIINIINSRRGGEGGRRRGHD